MATATKKKKKKAAPTTLHVGLVWDMSGSMQPVRAATLQGFNKYVRDLQADPKSDSTRFTLTVFDTEFEHWYTEAPIGEIPEIGSEYQPRGFTALNDAIVHTVERMRDQVKGDDSVLFVIMTDGGENSSHEYGNINPMYGVWQLGKGLMFGPGTDATKRILGDLEAAGAWTVVYLGAGLAAEQAAPMY